MKKLIAIGLLGMLTSCYNRIGDLNMASNRNIDSSQEYVLLQRNVTGKGKSNSTDALEQALDDATIKWQGEYMMNVAVYVKANGRKVKVVGDVYGIKSNTQNQ